MSSRTALLLHADPAFGAGAASFSSGLETLAADGLLTGPEQLVDVMLAAVRLRWHTFDRVFLARSHALGSGEVEARLDLDREVEVSMVGEAARVASRRSGTALLGTWQRLHHEAAATYRRRVLAEEGTGHLGVAQGLVWADLPLADAEALSCWAVLTACASSAVRLAVVGHRGAQEALVEVERRVAPLLAAPVDAAAVPHAFTPVHDVAIERHARSDVKLFAS
ncbi:urease accessory protein UreF [Nocardioides zeae]|uniref:Urease accessory protein n=1 Tax=Nocardioides zeae TaxID=1457234 RepID=A0AAJ1U502_9ACTN|nr:urease accessory UreF family protein [Nocardioides zeae]MDQ1106050.1 urease accessory protein [Nocardioides zeae]